MGWQGQHNRDEDAERRWRELPLRERYAWWNVALFVVMVVVVVILFVKRVDGIFR